MKSKMSQTCKQLTVGVIVIDTIIMIIGGIIAGLTSGVWLQFVLGVLLGGSFSVVLARHMDSSIDNALDMEEERATKYLRNRTIIRYVLMLLVLVLTLTFPQVFNVIGVLLGILALKFSAYAQPLTSKYIK